MKAPVRTTPAAAAAVAAAVALAGCATSLGDNAGAAVTATDRSVSLVLTEKHAWAPLLPRGADLVAEYPIPQVGLVREILSPATREGALGLGFVLPDRLRAAPGGPVCLYVQLRGNRSVVPVRKAASNGDTGRFRHAAWEQSVQATSALQQQEREVAQLETQLTDLERWLGVRKQDLDGRGWTTPARCDAISVTSAAPTSPPLGVLPAERHADAARQTCVNRATYTQRFRQSFIAKLVDAPNAEARGRALEAASSLAGMIEAGAANVQKMSASSDPQVTAVLARRQQQARELLADFRRFAPTLGKDFYPAFGKPDDHMELIGVAQLPHQKQILLEQAERLSLPADQRPTLTGNETLGLIGGMLDAYTGCVSDGQRELKVKLEAWTTLQRDGPERNRRIREHYVAECRAQHAALGAGQDQRSQLASKLAAARATAASLQGRATTARSTGSTKVVALNNATCN